MNAKGDVLAVEYLYAIEAEHDQGDDSRFHVPKRVITFRITKKTPKRIYYVRSERGHRRPDGSIPHVDIGFVDRQRLEADGELFRKSAGWWERDACLYLEPPVLELYAPAPDLAALKAAMREAHPDAGGSHEAFLQAHERYERARVNAHQEHSRTEQRYCGDTKRHSSHTFMRMEVLFQCPGEHGTGGDR